jgi:NitT/TauT family transport system permease protein
MMIRNLFPILVVVSAIMLIWYGASVGMNSKWTYDQAKRAGVEVGFSEMVADTWSQDRPVLPAPNQVVAELYKSTVTKNISSKRSLVFHGWITLSATMLGFLFGTGMGILLAIGIVYNRAMDMRVMPWAIASQTVPIIAIAPMIVVMVFFPVLVNTVQGLAATDLMQRDLMRTYAGGYWNTLFKLSLPAAMPAIFNGLKIATTLALIGAIVAEFFGSPTQGMGFRISVEVGGLGLDMVWAEITIAALAGSAFYGIIAMIEKGVTFWHPSQRG